MVCKEDQQQVHSCTFELNINGPVNVCASFLVLMFIWLYTGPIQFFVQVIRTYLTLTCHSLHTTPKLLPLQIKRDSVILIKSDHLLFLLTFNQIVNNNAHYHN